MWGAGRGRFPTSTGAVQLKQGTGLGFSVGESNSWFGVGYVFLHTFCQLAVEIRDVLLC